MLNNWSGLPQLLHGGTFASSDRDEFYVLFNQMLMRQGPGNTDGLIVFGGRCVRPTQ